jgi:hypothetical protein
MANVRLPVLCHIPCLTPNTHPHASMAKAWMLLHSALCWQHVWCCSRVVQVPCQLGLPGCAEGPAAQVVQPKWRALPQPSFLTVGMTSSTTVPPSTTNCTGTATCISCMRGVTLPGLLQCQPEAVPTWHLCKASYAAAYIWYTAWAAVADTGCEL